MKKFKIVISIILVMMLAITTSVTAFATDVNLDNEKWAMEQKVKDVEETAQEITVAKKEETDEDFTF